jgi:hypothetical protein
MCSRRQVKSGPRATRLNRSSDRGTWPKRTAAPPVKAAPQRGYNTNLASEFYVLSMLYRLGLDANLTLGNKKSVDITVVLGPGRAVTIDVKAVAGKMDWLMGSSPGFGEAESPRDLGVVRRRFRQRATGSSVLGLAPRRSPAFRQDREGQGEDAVLAPQAGTCQFW